jgi:hypothetical protein
MNARWPLAFLSVRFPGMVRRYFDKGETMRLVTWYVIVGAALLVAGCDQGAKAPEQAKSEPPAETASAPPAPTAPSGAQPCATTVERTVAFTAAQAKDRLVIEALGPDCANPALFARLYDPTGRLVYANMISGKWLMSAEMFPQGGGSAQTVIENLYDIGEPNSQTLPAWPENTPAPAKGSYGAFEAKVPQPAYERYRALNGVMMIRRGGGESGTFYIYDPELGEAVAVAQYAM